MQVAKSLCFYLFLVLMIFTFVGLYKPWITLWWKDTQPRKKVLRYYGLPALFCLLTYFILRLVGGEVLHLWISGVKLWL